MLFPTLTFGLFFVCVLAANTLLLRRTGTRKLMLLAASYIFYGAWDWRFCLLLFASSLINYGTGVAIRRAERMSVSRAWLCIGVVANLGILGFFKYYGFFIESLDVTLTMLGWQRDLPWLDVVLPVGISFFTFQGISYAVDTYRGQIREAPGFVDVLLYISFFPQLVAGPIVRAAHFLPQLRLPAAEQIHLAFGFTLIAWGLFKKVVVATYLAQGIVDPVFFDPLSYGAVDTWIAVYAYAIQIYCDFSAYSDIAIGVAALLGFSFSRNFDQPYRATSLRNFWHRWHISLSTWLRDYLYIPLGGGRGGALRTYRNLLLTMVLGGLWHGASWKFLAWGALHGGGLAVERAVRRWRPWSWLPMPLRVVLIFNFVCAGWILFRAETFELASEVFGRLFVFNEASSLASPFIVGLLIFGLLMHWMPGRLLIHLEHGLAKLPAVVQGLVMAVVVVGIDAMGVEGVAPFIYFQF